MKPLAVVTGVGPGTGTAIVRRFQAGGFQVAMLARDSDRLDGLAQELPDAFGIACDVTDPEAFGRALQAAEDRAGTVPKVVVHNAVSGAFGSFLDIDADVLERNFKVNVLALLQLAQWAAPKMEAAGEGSMIVTGNTSALRGKAKFAGFAPTKAAQRILAESIAREMGPKGVHIAYLIIDAVIDLPWTRDRFPDRPDEDFIRPTDIADEIWHIAHQPRSAWSFLSEIRPFRENW